MEIKKNSELYAVFTDLTKDGEGIGKIDGFTVFVKGALPGEECEVKIIKLKKSYCYGKLLKIVKPSSLRVLPGCQCFPKCGGCSIRHMSYEGQLALKKKITEDALKRIGGLNIKVNDVLGTENPERYRNKTRFPFVTNGNEAEICLYATGSHRGIAIQDCLLCPKHCAEIIEKIKEYVKTTNVTVYDENTGKGLLRHLVIRSGYNSEQIMVCLVINGNALPEKERLIQLLSSVAGVNSIVVCINKDKTNVILKGEIKKIWGNGYTEDFIGEIKYRISPISFFQVNACQAKKLYDTAVKAAKLSKSDTVLDLYCGIGAISLYIAKKVKKVIGVEISEAAVSDARFNAGINNMENAEFIQGRAEDVIFDLLSGGVSPDVLFLDPPRKGCDEKLIDAVIKSGVRRVVYISCNPATLARDLKALCQGGYSVGEISPIDMFPHTMHVETCCCLTK